MTELEAGWIKIGYAWTSVSKKAHDIVKELKRSEQVVEVPVAKDFLIRMNIQTEIQVPHSPELHQKLYRYVLRSFQMGRNGWDSDHYDFVNTLAVTSLKMRMSDDAPWCPVCLDAKYLEHLDIELS